MEQRNWLEKYEVEAYVGKNSQYYIKNWGDHRTDKIKGVNVSALFFPTQWLGYRKMYVQLAFSYLFMVFAFLFGVTTYYVIGTFNPFVICVLSRILVGIYFAAFGNGIYREKVLGCAQEHEIHCDEFMYKEFLKEKGRASIMAPVIITLFELWLVNAFLIAVFEASANYIQLMSY